MGPLEILSRMWIIARFDDEAELDRLEQEFKDVQSENPDRKYLVMLNDKNPLVRNSKLLLDYSYLLTFLFHTDQDFFEDQSFVIQKYYRDLSDFKIDMTVNNCINMFALGSFSNICYNESNRWKSFYHIKEHIIKVSDRLEVILEGDMEEKLLYIADSLRVIGEDMSDQRQILVAFTGIMELLLTHNPDYNRFNVEDSINKQFKLKGSLLIYLNDTTRDIDQIKKRLGEIYSQRSNIAHGDFKTLQKYIEKEHKILLKSDPDAEDSFVLENLNRDLRIYLRAILEELIKDKTLVNFMKNN